MGIIGTIFVGLIVGALARFLLPGDQKMGWIMTILLGIGGSLLAGFVGQALGWYTAGQALGWYTAGQALGWYTAGQGAGWIASVVGAIVLLLVVGKLSGGSKPS